VKIKDSELNGIKHPWNSISS